MPLTLHEASIAVMIHGFHNLAGVLERARLHAEEQSIDEAQFLDDRLFDDMMTMRQQVQRASDTAKRAAIRVAGVADVSMPDDEASFADLLRRIQATVDFLQAVPPEAINGGAGAEVTLTDLEVVRSVLTVAVGGRDPAKGLIQTTSFTAQACAALSTSPSLPPTSLGASSNEA